MPRLGASRRDWYNYSVTRILSLSTMWAQQERLERDMARFVEIARAAGYHAIEISHATPAAPLEALLKAPGVRLSSIHAPAPLVVDGNGRRNSSLNLASLDEEERALALAHTKRSIDRCEGAGARYVVVHLGGVGGEMFEEERRLRRLYDSGVRDGDEFSALRQRCVALRAEMAPPYLEQARRTLEELVTYASARGVAIGLENRLHYHEIPQVDEVDTLLAPYPRDVAGYWHDVGHAEVQSRLGLVDARTWLTRHGERVIGAHLHDVDGLADHRAPGRGTVDWSYIADGLPVDALRVFEIDQRQPEESLAAAVLHLHERGVV
jgi:sugar phosphate isomerase/epimerase